MVIFGEVYVQGGCGAVLVVEFAADEPYPFLGGRAGGVAEIAVNDEVDGVLLVAQGEPDRFRGYGSGQRLLDESVCGEVDLLG